MLFSMESTRIAELLAPFVSAPLSDAQLAQLSAYLDLLMKWNTKTNLTAVRDPEQMVTRHFGESLFAAEKLLQEPVATAIDLGSGAGFPGLPLAIYAPDVKVALIESQNKKATFLKEVVRAIGLKNVTVNQGRGEDFRGSAQLVTMRAVEKFTESIKLAASLVAPGGRLAMLISAGQVVVAEEKDRMQWELPVDVPGSEKRILLVGRKPVSSLRDSVPS